MIETMNWRALILLTLVTPGCLPNVVFVPCLETGRCALDAPASDTSIDATRDNRADVGYPMDTKFLVDSLLPDAATFESGTDAATTDTLAPDVSSMDIAPSDVSIDTEAPDIPSMISCDAGSVVEDGACSAIPPRRLVAPISGSYVTNSRPQLRVAPSASMDDVVIELSRQRIFTTVAQRIVVRGAVAVPTETLSPGVWYWRSFGTRGSSSGTQSSAVWEFLVGPRSNAIDSSWIGFTDLNGDGYADLAVAERRAVLVYYGGATGLRSSPSVLGVSVPDEVIDFISQLRSAGDLNGDGFGDLLVSVSYITTAGGRFRATLVYAGSSGGVSLAPVFVYDRVSYTAEPIGDFDGDGYADLWIDGMLTRGSAGTWPVDGRTVRPSVGVQTGFGVGDLNGDGFADVAFTAPTTADGGASYNAVVYLGNVEGRTSRVDATLSGIASITPLGDVNGDGFADFQALRYPDRAWLLYLGGTVLGSASPLTTERVFGAAGDVDGDGFMDAITISDTAASVLRGAAASPFAARTRLSGIAGSDLPVNTFSNARSPGDIDGDGASDFAIGGALNQVLVFSGRALGPAGIALRVLTGSPSSEFGSAIAY